MAATAAEIKEYAEAIHEFLMRHAARDLDELKAAVKSALDTRSLPEAARQVLLSYLAAIEEARWQANIPAEESDRRQLEHLDKCISEIRQMLWEVDVDTRTIEWARDGLSRATRERDAIRARYSS